MKAGSLPGMLLLIGIVFSILVLVLQLLRRLLIINETIQLPIVLWERGTEA